MDVCVRMNRSLDALDRAIAAAGGGIAEQKNRRPDLEQRIECYREVVRRQRLVAQALQEQLLLKNWAKANHYLRLIRTASQLIQFDVQSLLFELQKDHLAAAN